jgi:hypothetical protein
MRSQIHERLVRLIDAILVEWIGSVPSRTCIESNNTPYGCHVSATTPQLCPQKGQTRRKFHLQDVCPQQDAPCLTTPARRSSLDNLTRLGQNITGRIQLITGSQVFLKRVSVQLLARVFMRQV